jgi:hypothetical protein
MGEIYGCNSPDRIDLAHSYLEPHPDGSLSLQRPGKSPKLWTSTDLGDKIAKLNELTIKLDAVGSTQPPPLTLRDAEQKKQD